MLLDRGLYELDDFVHNVQHLCVLKYTVTLYTKYVLHQTINEKRKHYNPIRIQKSINVYFYL